ncbi:MAG: chemotaxis protein CheX [Opitutaceae bacterium]|nr:chemotaxis protein CheX [Opitutaceae bacterium]
MPTIERISEVVFRETINRAVQDVVKTMLNQNAVFHSESEAAHTSSSPIEIEGQQVVGTVGFIGDINGLIYLYLGSEFAALSASHLLGMTREELDEAGDEVVNDAIGELTNMTVGAFKNQLCDRGFACKLTIPSILRGSNFSIEPISSAIRRIYRFDIGNHRLVADLLMKIED